MSGSEGFLFDPIEDRARAIRKRLEAAVESYQTGKQAERAGAAAGARQHFAWAFKHLDQMAESVTKLREEIAATSPLTQTAAEVAARYGTDRPMAAPAAPVSEPRHVAGPSGTHRCLEGPNTSGVEGDAGHVWTCETPATCRLPYTVACAAHAPALGAGR